jgi:hypothetical protein
MDVLSVAEINFSATDTAIAYLRNTGLLLLLTVITGMSFSIAKSFRQRQLASFLIHLHRLEHLDWRTSFPSLMALGCWVC